MNISNNYNNLYINIGGDKVIYTDSIIGIFDIDNTTTAKSTRDFLNQSESDGRVTNLAADIPVSFILSDSGVYLSPYAPRTLMKICSKKA